MRMIKAIFRAVIWAVKSAFIFLFRIINKFRLWLLIVYLAVCGIVQLASGFFSRTGFNVIFWAGFIIVVFITLFLLLISFGGRIADKVKNRKPSEKREKTPKEKYPKYFLVDGATDFFMAEYKDRFELYRKGEDGKPVYVRTDKKEKNKQTEKTKKA